MVESPHRLPKRRRNAPSTVKRCCCCVTHHHGTDGLQRNRRTPLASFLVIAATAATGSQGVSGFTGVHTSSAFAGLRSAPQSRRDLNNAFNSPASCLQLSTKEEAAPLVVEPMSASTNSPVKLLMDPSSFMDQDEDVEDTMGVGGMSSFPVKAVSVGTLLLILSQTTLPMTMISAYSNLLIEYPLPTKSLTSGALCGVSDIIAQYRDSSRKEFNYGRLIRFAGKGCIGGIIWSFWYDNLDRFLNLDSGMNIYKIPGMVSGNEDLINYQWMRDHMALVTTALSILIEQFFWCPIVFGTFEIPISTLLNGGTFSSVQKEVDSKLGGLLVSNAKVWTLANVIIYNAPVEWRPAVSSCVDVLWQSIVSDVAADCGKVDDDICELPDLEDEKDYSFYAEKSRK